jgi:hypothetical protein
LPSRKMFHRGPVPVPVLRRYLLVRRCHVQVRQDEGAGVHRSCQRCRPVAGVDRAVVHARKMLDRIIRAARTAGAPAVLLLPLAMFSEFELRRGKIVAAYAAAAESGQAGLSSFSLAPLARVEAVLGRDEDCRAHVAAGLRCPGLQRSRFSASRCSAGTSAPSGLVVMSQKLSTLGDGRAIGQLRLRPFQLVTWRFSR